MNIFMTNGTFDYLKRIKEKHPQEMLLLMENDNSALLLHETARSTIFNEPRRFEIIEGVGDLDTSGFVVMNHIPVTDEGRPVIEYRFKNRHRLIEKQAGFIALRVLRPLKNNTYVILTMWKDEYSFQLWKQSADFKNAHKEKETPQTIGVQANVFAGPSYVSTYLIREEEEENLS